MEVPSKQRADDSHRDDQPAKKLKQAIIGEKGEVKLQAPPTVNEADIALIRSTDHYIKNMYLKRIIKENYSGNISAVSFNRIFDTVSNLLATVGDNQVNIYDNENHGDHLDLVSHYVHTQPAESADQPKGLLCCCWTGTDPRDPMLAVGAQDGSVLVIRMSESRVAALLSGHTAPVQHLRSSSRHPYLLLSASRDGTVRLWNLYSMCCIAVFNMGEKTPATSLCLDPNSNAFVTGHTGGAVRRWELPSSALDPDTMLPEPQIIQQSASKPFKKHHVTEISSLRFWNKSLVSQSLDGKICVWQADGAFDLLKEYRVPSADSRVPCQFDITTDNRYLCTGNSKGELFVYDLEAENRAPIKKLENKRNRTPVRAVQFSKDMRNIVFIAGGQYLWRWDYVEPELIAAFYAEDAAEEESNNQ